MNKWTAFLVLGVLWASASGTTVTFASANPITADHTTTRVIDGDSIQVGDTVLQLSGIDAPELGQTCDDGGRHWPCGLDAAYRLRKLIALTSTPEISCFRVVASFVGARVATCMRGGEDLSVAMLQAGDAVVVPEGAPHYVAAEAPFYAEAELAARQASLGIWASKFEFPWDWRRKREQAGADGADPSCPLKGKVAADGQRLYYGPLDPEYEAFAVDAARGDRFFCSDDQARAAGWLRPGEKPHGK